VVCAEAGGITPDRAKGMDDFKARFKARFNADVQIYAPYVYDATMVMVSAMQKADSTDPKKYLAELAKITHEGVTGKIAFDAKGDIRNGSLTLYTYKGGKREAMRVVQ
jgi:branched-chain amino acid transport system substrate-binding protein